MSKMTIEQQIQAIEEEQRIIDSITKHKPIKEYDILYIKDLKKKINQRKEWICEQENQMKI